MLNKLKLFIKKIEDWEKKHVRLFYGLTITIFLIIELIIITAARSYKNHRFQQLQAQSEKKMQEKLFKKLDGFEVRILNIK